MINLGVTLPIVYPTVEDPGEDGSIPEKTVSKGNRPLGRRMGQLLFQLRSEMRYEAMLYFALPETSQMTE